MKIKFHKLTIAASLLLTTVMLLVAMLFDISKEMLKATDVSFLTPLFFSFLVMIVVNYSILELLFTFYGKRQVKKISTILPDEFVKDEEEMSLKTLGEKMSKLSQKKSEEIDTMKSMESYRKEYVGNISHELKTPLFSIQGYLETLLDGGVENLNIRDKYLERVSNLTERLLNIVMELDMLNKYENGEIKLQISTFEITTIVREIFELLDLESNKRTAKFRLTSSQPKIFVKADKQKIFQVLLNLISNAVYYSNRENALITVKTIVENSHVKISVEDNGMGIKPELLPRVFERFFRVESSRNRREGGSGLGLSIVKHILEAHHENITVSSVYLEGATFTFNLPLMLE